MAPMVLGQAASLCLSWGLGHGDEGGRGIRKCGEGNQESRGGRGASLESWWLA